MDNAEAAPQAEADAATREKAIRYVRDVINDRCIARVPPGSHELPAMGGNGWYEWQFYLRRALLDPYCLRVMAAHFWEHFGPALEAEPFQVAGVESAAVPLLTTLVLTAKQPLNAFTIRKERKAYGLRNIVEGRPNPLLPVVFVDDLTSPSHNAFWHAMDALRQEQLALHPLGYVLVRKQRRSEPAVIPTGRGNVLIVSMFDLDDFDLTTAAYAAAKGVTT